MSWVYLDDHFPEHPKVVEAGGDAAWLYVCGLAFVNRHLTGGRIPKAIVGRLSDRAKPDQLAKRLVKVGLWVETEDGYRIHDYDDHNRTAERERQRRSEKARHAAQTRWDTDAQAMPEHVPKHDREHALSSASGIAQASTEHVPEHAASNARAMPPVRGPAPSPSPSPSLEPPPPLTSRDSLGPSANGAGLAAGEEEDSGKKSRSKARGVGQTDPVEAHLHGTCMVIAARRLLARPPGSEPIRQADLWQAKVADESAERFREAHRALFSDSVAVHGKPLTEQETASILEPPVGVDAIDATALDDP